MFSFELFSFQWFALPLHRWSEFFLISSLSYKFNLARLYVEYILLHIKFAALAFLSMGCILFIAPGLLYQHSTILTVVERLKEPMSHFYGNQIFPLRNLLR